MSKLFEVLYTMNRNKNYSQRDLSNACQISIGNVNAIIKEAEELGFIHIKQTKARNYYNLTEEGIKALENWITNEKEKKINIHLNEEKSIKSAVILAAGRRAEFNMPIGLLTLGEERLVDRAIRILMENGIENIAIVTGYKSESFAEIAEKNPKVTLVKNEQYKRTGTMKSLSLVEGIIQDDFLLLESDIIFEEQAIKKLLKNKDRDSMIITNESGSGDEALVEIREGYIYNMSKDIHQLNKIDGEMIGISKVSYKIFQKMLKQFENNKNPYLNYEYMLLDIGRKYKIGYEKIAELVWYEIDTEAHYQKLIKDIYRRLLRQEEKFRTETIKDLLIDLMDVTREEISHVEFAGGMTNKNFKVTIKEKDYVLRIPGNGTDEMISRANEKFNSMAANKLGLDAEIFFFDEYKGLKVAEFIQGAETMNPQTAKRDDVMNETTHLLRELHQSGIQFNNEFDVFAEIEKYERLVKEANGYFYEDYETIKSKVMKLEELLEGLDRQRVACHNDTVPENFVKDAKSQFYLIDWEYSGENDPMWDLAAHSLECVFSEDEEEIYLQKYFQTTEVEEKYKTKMLIFKICQDFLWSIWTWIKEAKGDDFGTYGMDRYNRAKMNLDKLGE